MSTPSLAGFTGPQLFQLCAAHPDDEGYWAEFVRRFNPLLARSVAYAYRRNTGGEWPAADVAADLLQDVYALVVRDGFRLLRQFRGGTEAEAEAYLAHAATNRTISHLRARGAQKRQAEVVSLEALRREGGGELPALDASVNGRAGLSEREFVEALRQAFRGPHDRRDTLIFLLHFRDGWSAAEIARMGLCDLRESSIANLLGLLKKRLRDFLASEV
jgi:DNA-directed RNA polymerase specialized sigma24 family protein